MPDVERVEAELRELQLIVEELIETVHEEARQIEQFVTVVEQQTSLRDTPRELRVVVAKPAELHHRVKKLFNGNIPGRQGS
jgi:hypothetical protein